MSPTTGFYRALASLETTKEKQERLGPKGPTIIFSPEAPEVLGKNPPQKREDIRALLRELGFEGISCNMISKQKACNFLPNSVQKVWVTEIAMARLKEVFPKINENRFWAR